VHPRDHGLYHWSNKATRLAQLPVELQGAPRAITPSAGSWRTGTRLPIAAVKQKKKSKYYGSFQPHHRCFTTLNSLQVAGFPLWLKNYRMHLSLTAQENSDNGLIQRIVLLRLARLRTY
jgi:hypothetical protein